MNQKKLYIIAGCNGAGKTTAAFNMLADTLNCVEFVNADEIARGISPFNPDSVAIDAARLMIKRIAELMNAGEDFAFETTLATRTHINTVKKAQKSGYHVTLLFYWLESKELARKRVEKRVEEGGHAIPPDVIDQRYEIGLKYLFELYMPICDYTVIFDNSKTDSVLIAEKQLNQKKQILDQIRLDRMKQILDELK